MIEVATISANNDESLGKLIAEAFYLTKDIEKILNKIDAILEYSTQNNQCAIKLSKKTEELQEHTNTVTSKLNEFQV